MAGLELLYGRNSVREALLARRRHIYRLFLAAGATPGGALNDIVRLAMEANIPIKEMDRAALDRMAGAANHHGVMAEAATYPYASLFDFVERARQPEPPALILILDYLQDPQNLGTLVRTAEAAGVDGVVIPQHRAAGVTPAAVNASAGATEHLAIAEAPNLARAIKELKAAGLWVIGLEKVDGAPLHVDADLTGPIALVIGGEGRGMSRLTRESCDVLIQLPTLGKVNSLNAAAAGSIALFEIWRQRRAKAAG
jgi:23S rRNA (guanosine2251-2'-O)-methyltransferase